MKTAAAVIQPEKKKKEKPTPVKCACKKAPVLVSIRGGRMMTCPDPLCCPGNLRTRWCKSENSAIEEWNVVVSNFKHRRENGN